MFACLLPQAEFLVGHVVEQVEILKDTRVLLLILFQSRDLPSLPPVLEVYPDELAEDRESVGMIGGRHEIGHRGPAVDGKSRLIGFDNIAEARPLSPI